LNIPAEFFQGYSVSWTDSAITARDGQRITSPDWALTYYFAGPTVFNIVGSPSGGAWDFDLSPGETAAMTAADTPNYAWQAVATNGAQKITIGTGQSRAVQNLASATAGFDPRTQDEIDLAAVEAAIRARIAGGAVAEYSIGSRRLRNEGMTELRALAKEIKLRIRRARRRESINNGGGDPFVSYVSFRR
jgi:hypothetical protein